MSKLSIDNIVTINVSINEVYDNTSGYNIGLIIGNSAHIPVATRVKSYASLSSMVDDGFLVTDPEYVAAKMYFNQTPRPGSVLIGVVGENEQPVAAVNACWDVNSSWYGLYYCGASDVNVQAIAEAIADRKVCLFYDTHDANAPDATKSTDVFSKIKEAGYQNNIGIFSSTENAGAALMGRAMGLNDGTDNSAFTLAYKNLVGVAPESLTSAQITALKAKNANYFINRSNTYDVLEPGFCGDGSPFDEVLGIHQLSGNMQTAVMDLFTNVRTRKVPYTDEGTKMIIAVLNKVCAAARDRGFIAPGIWNGPDVLDLKEGDPLSEGYLIQAIPVAKMTPAQRKSRTAPPIYACIKLAGAIEFVVININIDR